MATKSLIVIASFLISFAAEWQNQKDTSCPQPTNVHVTGQSSGSISFDWDDCGCLANSYKVKYVRQSDGYNSPDYATSASNYSFSGLQAGTYTFQFWTQCVGGPSEVITVEDLSIN